MQEVFGYRTYRAVKTDTCVYCDLDFIVTDMIETGPVYRVVVTEDGPVHIDSGEQYHACGPCADEIAALDHADYVTGKWDQRDLEDEFGMGVW